MPDPPFAGVEYKKRPPKKLFAVVDHGDVVVCIVLESVFDYAKLHGAEALEVPVDSMIRIKVADFDEWIAGMQAWWDEEKEKLQREERNV